MRHPLGNPVLVAALWMGTALFPVHLFGATAFSADAVKIDTVLKDTQVAAKFRNSRGIDSVSKIPAGLADLLAFRVRSENCWVTVNLRVLPTSTTLVPHYEVAEVGEWECAAPVRPERSELDPLD